MAQRGKRKEERGNRSADYADYAEQVQLMVNRYLLLVASLPKIAQSPVREHGAERMAKIVICYTLLVIRRERLLIAPMKYASPRLNGFQI